jgi:putative transposase
MVDLNNDQISIRRQCDILDVGRSNVYYVPVSPPDESLMANEIHEVWLNKPYYGYRKIAETLRRSGHNINHKRVLRIMRDMHIQAIYRKPATTINNPEHKIYPYLLRNLEISGPDQVWESDLTYIRMPSGFMYLIAIIDVYSRYCTGWAFVNTMDGHHCNHMLEETLNRGRKPRILNTDQGSQFTSPVWTQLVEQNNIQVSMDGKGRWADNIYIERFWKTMKYEHILLHEFQTVAEARASIARFIATYNNERLHQSLGYAIPTEVYGGTVKIPSFRL